VFLDLTARMIAERLLGASRSGGNPDMRRLNQGL
jgi:hypothetical protein